MAVHQVVPIAASPMGAEWIQAADLGPADRCADASEYMAPWNT